MKKQRPPRKMSAAERERRALRDHNAIQGGVASASDIAEGIRRFAAERERARSNDPQVPFAWLCPECKREHAVRHPNAVVDGKLFCPELSNEVQTVFDISDCQIRPI